MQIDIRSIHFKTDKKLDDFIKEKVSKLPQYYDGVIASEIILKLANIEGAENKIAEIKLAIPGNDLYARKQSKSFEEATDGAVDALRRQLIKHKEKVRKV
ncbi:MAG: ribosome-associated translation inhibitor RaiA [Bacteroidales bacterium]|jgi:putative sigma-54 modulation protein|nr:ribosome-associated translation inhibitor RaiA [Bacteroidales bacterium]NCU36365.1 ribosome-associated translation inhibitor RaiA [Candidatus Falkowbacteria bacterium]MDD2631036.1 ribosome-associated translation inhibitor RaiA [Bacteroidales bacterium]MDD3130357.1 ribosome-associated translation inhibitor RaiA [Bacteroidales bacterium]MDD3526640.1 ribosome-associated translation inhibitor RaiA [Bacteroidales bacterium]